MDRKLLYGGLLLAAAGVGLVHMCRGPRLVPGQTRLLVVGDSLAVGLAPPLRALAQEARVAFDAQVLSGTRVDQWAASQKLEAKLGAFKPTLVLVSLGTNDAQMTAPGSTEVQLRAQQTLLGKLRAAGAEVGWIGAPTLPHVPNPELLEKLQLGVPGADYFHSEKLEIPRSPDGIHSTPRGYAGWAGAIWRWLS